MFKKEAHYRDRSEAGEMLADLLGAFVKTGAVVLAVPNGGVAVAGPIAQKLGARLGLLVVRKIQIPGNTEAGFGAVGAGGEYVVDSDMVKTLRLTPAEVEIQKQKAMSSVASRLSQYGEWARLPLLKKKTVILVDDGLATGGTMEAGIRIVRPQDPEMLIVAAPTGSERAVNRLYPLVDKMLCPHVGHGPVYAVASAYRNWHDVSDQEVLTTLKALSGLQADVSQ